jgi:hypothetical protein
VIISSSEPTATRDWSPWRGGTVTATGSTFVDVIIIPSYGYGYNDSAPAEQLPWIETPAERRLRLSREGVIRRVKESLNFVCRMRSLWMHVRYVARTVAQSERWRVLA